MARNALTRTSILSDISSYKKAGNTSSIHQIQQLGHVKAVKTAIHVLKSQHAADVRRKWQRGTSSHTAGASKSMRDNDQATSTQWRKTIVTQVLER